MPAYNEEVAIGSVVLRARRHVEKVIVVDDGSTDATSKIAELAGAEVIKHERNLGKGAALRDAFEWVRGLDADVLVILDADGQHNPDEIPRLIDPIVNCEADVVVGSRFLRGKHSVPRYRRIGQEVLTFLTNLVTRTKIGDSQSGFRAFSKRAMDSLEFKEMGIGIESQMHRSACDLNLSIKEVPISCRYDVVNRSKLNPFYHGFSVINAILRVVEERRPLLFFGTPGFVLVCIGMYYGLRVVSIFREGGAFAIGTAVVTLLFVMVGVLTIFTGIMLHTITGIVQKMK
ncbi:MAG: glycosyltransferase family 2 protein [Halobacteriota archaeon]|nr:glycosyltransferase family 2 protein [Halobacteriota archaeon]